MTNAALRGKPDAGNPHVRFDGGEVALAATPRRGSLLYKARLIQNAAILGMCCAAFSLCADTLTWKGGTSGDFSAAANW